MTLTHVANNRILFLSGNLYREDHTCQMNHPDREQNRAIIYTPGWRSPKTSRSGLHPRRPLTYATSRRNPSRPWGAPAGAWTHRSEEHTSELQSLMRISYDVFCFKANTSNYI